MERFLFNLRIASEALLQNKVRSFLTALGIIFGVASVISMQAIGRGARQQIMEQIKLVGVNNIIIEHKAPDPNERPQDRTTAKQKKKPSSLGLSLADAESISSQIPHVARVSPEAVFPVFSLRNGKGRSASLIGVQPDYFGIMSLAIKRGRTFSKEEMESAAPVCVISEDVKNQFFGGENPIGKSLKCGTLWLKVVGVLAGRDIDEEAAKNLKVTATKLNVYAPINTVILRYRNRALITQSRIGGGGFYGGDFYIESDQSAKEKPDYHEVDKLIVQVTEPKYLKKVEEVVVRMLNRRHNGADDFTSTIPELLLKQEQETQNIFYVVLAVLAGISLLVGGIGIMNTMLMSVMERMREIGIRQALGATRSDIVLQFLAETFLISVAGGLAGIGLGIGMSFVITHAASIITIITTFSIVLAFLVSVSVGIAFGVAPARKAARQDPVESLRHE